VAANGEEIATWQDWVSLIRNSAGTSVLVEVDRAGEHIEVEAWPQSITLDSGEVIGRIGVMPVAPVAPDDWVREVHPGPVKAFVMGVDKTWSLIVLTLDSLWKMLMGDVSVKNLSGPITIAKVAGDSASGGLIVFVNFLALLSVSLGVLNLLPVPMLDGGHILFYTAELIRGKPLPESVQIAAVKVGMMLLLMLMIVAFYNDISRL
jgi:regulator of sigma E protease